MWGGVLECASGSVLLRGQLDGGWGTDWGDAPVGYFMYVRLHIKQQLDGHVGYSKEVYDRVLGDREN